MLESRRVRLGAVAIAGVVTSAVLAAQVGHAAPSAAAGYAINVFAGPLAGSSAPDSIAVVGSRVFVGYGNGGDPGGLNGAMSTIAEYTHSGALVGTLTVVGHNDGLRYDAATGQLWSIQNEDANPNLVLINPKTFTASAPLGFSSTPHGGGYDDVAFGPSGTYISASNPANSPNTAPAIVSVTAGAGGVTVNGGVLAGNATATVINTGGMTTLNLQDPDSLIFGPGGQLVLDSQSDQQLVFVGGVGGPSQSVSVLNLPSTVDDTVFGRGGYGQLLVADRASGTIYSVTGKFAAGAAYSAADTLSQVVNVNLSTGAFTPLVTGLNGPHGEAFTATVPEPSAWAMMLVGFGLLGATARRRSLRLATVQGIVRKRA